jgi:hypothetical protein
MHINVGKHCPKKRLADEGWGLGGDGVNKLGEGRILSILYSKIF